MRINPTLHILASIFAVACGRGETNDAKTCVDSLTFQNRVSYGSSTTTAHYATLDTTCGQFLWSNNGAAFWEAGLSKKPLKATLLIDDQALAVTYNLPFLSRPHQISLDVESIFDQDEKVNTLSVIFRLRD